MDEQLRAAALEYHRLPTSGKISVTPTKALINQRDLALAYSPGWPPPATPSPRIRPRRTRSPRAATSSPSSPTAPRCWASATSARSRASRSWKARPACFKKFAGIDVFDIELAETDPEEMVKTIARLEPTFGGINLEDIKAPDCFYIERKLRERMKIPVFHDDQHGTAIVAGRGDPQRRSRSFGKDIAKVKLVCSGAGAAAIACLDLMVRRRIEARERHRLRQQGRHLHRARIADGGEQGALRAGHEGRARSPTRFAAPTSFSAFPDREC